MIDIVSKKPTEVKTFIRSSRVKKILGLNEDVNLRGILARGGFRVMGETADKLDVTVPSFRNDIHSEVDLIEEVAVHYPDGGYNRILSDSDIGLRLAQKPKEDVVENVVKEVLRSMGYFEVLTSSFCNDYAYMNPAVFSYWSNTPSDIIFLKNPMGVTDKILRKSLMQGLVDVIKRNERYKKELNNIFEISKVYYITNGMPQEKTVLGIVSRDGISSLKGAIKELFNNIAVTAVLAPKNCSFTKEGSSLSISVGKDNIGYVGIDDSHKSIRGLVPEDIVVCEIDFEKLVGYSTFNNTYKGFSRLPSIRRDLAIVLDEVVTWERLESCVRKSAPDFLESIEFFDIYRGNQIPKGKKSIAFSLSFRLPDKTLTNEEVDVVINRIVENIKKDVNGYLRQ